MSSVKELLLNLQSQVNELQSKKLETTNLKNNYSEFVLKYNESLKELTAKITALETTINSLASNQLALSNKISSLEKELVI